MREDEARLERNCILKQRERRANRLGCAPVPQLAPEGLAVNPAELRLYRERSLGLIAMGREQAGVESLLRYRTLAGTAADDLARCAPLNCYHLPTRP